MSANAPHPLNQPFDYAHATAALVTGASRGIGAEFARELARRGTPLLALVARSADDLGTLAAELRERYGTRVEVIVADLADAGAPAAIHAATESAGLSVDLLVNNAGFGDYGAFETRDVAKQTAMVGVNVTNLVALTGLYLPRMVARGGGGVVNVASTASFQPVPYMSTYAATKAFVLSFSEALWAENQDRGTGVRIVCLCPGNTDTNFGAVATDASTAGRGLFESIPADSAETVARAGLDALDQNASYAVVGALNYVGALSTRLAPRAAVARVGAAMFRPAEAKKSTGSNPADARRRAAIASAALAASLVAAVVVARRRK